MVDAKLVLTGELLHRSRDRIEVLLNGNWLLQRDTGAGDGHNQHITRNGVA